MFCSLKLCVKCELIYYIVNNILLAQNLTCIMSLKNMQFNGYIFKICSNVNFLKEVVALGYNQFCS